MNRNCRRKTSPPGAPTDGSPPSAAWLFAQQLLGKPIPNPASAAIEARRKREQLEWLAQISSEHAIELRRLQSQDAEANRKREQLEWLATISTEHERQLRNVLREEADLREAYARWEAAYRESVGIQEAGYDPAKHPRGGYSQNRGWWSPSGGSAIGSNQPSDANAFQGSPPILPVQASQK